jgi:hypothetical protein
VSPQGEEARRGARRHPYHGPPARGAGRLASFSSGTNSPINPPLIAGYGLLEKKLYKPLTIRPLSGTIIAQLLNKPSD